MNNNNNNIGSDSNNNNSNIFNNNSAIHDISDEQLDLCYYLLKECEINLPLQEVVDEEDEENNNNNNNNLSSSNNNFNNNSCLPLGFHQSRNGCCKGLTNDGDILCSIEPNQNTETTLVKSDCSVDLDHHAVRCSQFSSSPLFTDSTNNRFRVMSTTDSECDQDLEIDLNDSTFDAFSPSEEYYRGNEDNNNSNSSSNNCHGDSIDCADENMASPCSVEDVRCVSSSCSNLMRAAVKAYKSRKLTPILKEELKLLIQSRRVSQGKEEMEVEFQVPSPSKLNAREVERIERRKAQNRMAAKRCRQKKKTVEDSLLQKIKELKDFNLGLVSKLETLQGEKQQLLEVLVQHSLVCPCFAETYPLQKLIDGSTCSNSSVR